MIVNNRALAVYFDKTVNNVFKILPLYEEENIGVNTYVESLLLEIDSLQDIIKIEFTYEYLALLATLSSLGKVIIKEGNQKAIVRREVFKCLNIIKNMIVKLENGV